MEPTGRMTGIDPSFKEYIPFSSSCKEFSSKCFLQIVKNSFFISFSSPQQIFIHSSLSVELLGNLYEITPNHFLIFSFAYNEGY